jgi:hypothetical protein
MKVLPVLIGGAVSAVPLHLNLFSVFQEIWHCFYFLANRPFGENVKS